MSSFEVDCDILLKSFAPTELSNKKRKDIHEFAVDVIRRKLPSINVFGVGSSALKTYLPESDVDLVLLTDDNDPESSDVLRNILGSIFNALCEEISLKDDNKSSYKGMTIRNIELVNGRKKVAHCVVNNVGVDITVNQVSSLATITFLEEVDRFIGHDHLLKRSVLLIKSWCLNESTKYCNQTIIGAKHGMLSAYAITVMVLSLFNQPIMSDGTVALAFTHPFAVLRSFMQTYANFNWEGYVVTTEGPVAIQSGTSGNQSNPSNSSAIVSTLGGNIGGSGGMGGNVIIDGVVPQGNGNKEPLMLEPLIKQFKTYLGNAAVSAAAATATSAFANRGSNNSTQSGDNMSHGTHNGSMMPPPRFSLRACNIQDPIDSQNNLGISVSRPNLVLIDCALKGGLYHLEYIITYTLWRQNQVRKGVLVSVLIGALLVVFLDSILFAATCEGLRKTNLHQ